MTEEYRKRVIAIALYYYGAKGYSWPEAIRAAESDLYLQSQQNWINSL